ncbi:peptide chain release factor N(5)-glutamine methyltransferase [Buchnera aphidicola]|uniref:Release factor glutamine methyltransferase n=1 Tax=Buchnera aphidicola (Cinara strobi) TaxID=1921549 RepID=A0A3B1E9E3_9GAMM|nr:peptide chain release factor N(5)-glutamine methyltransferase [Buchnera aphidicola]VAX76399.1 Release factor glutamine methyltransferase [Buchnera aphidicola (Cinara strobi)]
MNVLTWLLTSQKKLVRSFTPKLDVELLLCFVLKISKEKLFLKQNKIIHENDLYILNTFLRRRILGEPVAYILQKKEFWSLPLFVSRHVLVPRPDTEILVEQVLLKVSSVCKNILELGTGSGAISLALASEFPKCKITGTDISLPSLSIARYNAIQLNIKNIKFIYSDWFSNVPVKRFHIIVSNPPYLSEDDLSLASSRDLFFEPRHALVSGKHGIECIQYIIENSFRYFISSGWLYIEHCHKQALKVKILFQKNFYTKVSSVMDYSNRNRVTFGYLNK